MIYATGSAPTTLPQDLLEYTHPAVAALFCRGELKLFGQTAPTLVSINAV